MAPIAQSLDGQEPTLGHRANRLLAALPLAEYARLEPDLELVTPPLGQVLYQPDQPITHIFFPLTGLLSLVGLSQDGVAVEVACAGNDGMVGLPVFLGGTTDSYQAIVQIPGQMLRLPVAAFQTALHQDGALFAVLQRYTRVFLVHLGQSAVCNRLHPIEQRCARWLLESQDRVQTQTFPLTQEFLATMLGVHRPSVTLAAGALQQVGLIQYHRGIVTILDRERLETASCECYAVISQATTRLLGEAPERAL